MPARRHVAHVAGASRGSSSEHPICAFSFVGKAEPEPTGAAHRRLEQRAGGERQRNRDAPHAGIARQGGNADHHPLQSYRRGMATMRNT